MLFRSVSRFDRYSHILPAHLMFTPCAFYAQTPAPGCDAHLSPLSRPTQAQVPRSPRRAPGRPAPVAPSPAPLRRLLDYLLGG